MHHDPLRSPLSKARGLGSAKSGFSHWWLQRLSALALIPLSIWFMCNVLNILIQADRFAISLWLEQPFNTLLLSLMLVALFLHAKLGVQVVIEDYVHRESRKIAALILNNFFFIALAAISLLSVFKLHFFGI